MKELPPNKVQLLKRDSLFGRWLHKDKNLEQLIPICSRYWAIANNNCSSHTPLGAIVKLTAAN